MQHKVTTSNPPTCVVRQAYVTKKILDRQIHFASMRNGLLFLPIISKKYPKWRRLSTVSYGHSRFTMEEIGIFEHVENHATEKNETTEVLRSITEAQGYIYGPVADVLRLPTEAQRFTTVALPASKP